MDFDADDDADSTGDTARFVFPESWGPGLYPVSLRATDTQGRTSMDRIGITLTEAQVAGQSLLVPQSGANIAITDANAALNGARVMIPETAVNENGRATLGELGPEAFPFLPEGDFLRAVELGPQRMAFSDWVTVTIPVPAFDDDEMRTAHVFRFDETTNQWLTTGIRGGRLLQSGPDRFTFEVTQGDTYAIIGEPYPTGPFGCNRFPDDRKTGGGWVYAALILALAAGPVPVSPLSVYGCNILPSKRSYLSWVG